MIMAFASIGFSGEASLQSRSNFVIELISGLPDGAQEKVASCMDIDFEDSNAATVLIDEAKEGSALSLIKIEACVLKVMN